MLVHHTFNESRQAALRLAATMPGSHTLQDSPARRAAPLESAALRLNTVASGWADGLPDQPHEEDPWEGCDDLVAADLEEWRRDHERLMLKARSLLPPQVLETECPDCAGRTSSGTVSTTSRLSSASSWLDSESSWDMSVLTSRADDERSPLAAKFGGFSADGDELSRTFSSRHDKLLGSSLSPCGDDWVPPERRRCQRDGGDSTGKRLAAPQSWAPALEPAAALPASCSLVARQATTPRSHSKLRRSGTGTVSILASTLRPSEVHQPVVP